MGCITVIRDEKIVTLDVTWTDDVVVEWAEDDGVCIVRAALDYAEADARIILRRGPSEMVLASGLGREMSYSGKHAVAKGDEVVLQWRALVPSEPGVSEVAEVTLEAMQDQFEAEETKS